jgi:hypothetical protein
VEGRRNQQNQKQVVGADHDDEGVKRQGAAGDVAPADSADEVHEQQRDVEERSMRRACPEKPTTSIWTNAAVVTSALAVQPTASPACRPRSPVGGA